jgi:penicillin-binding protein 1C
VLFAGLVLLLGVVGSLGALLWASSLSLPTTSLAPYHSATLSIRDREGRLLRDVLSRPDGRSYWVPLAEISPHLIAATVASEDQRFFVHQGVDFDALLRALLLNSAKERVVTGGSTLTMQLVRLLRPRRRTLKHKIEEAVLATRLEKDLSKKQILYQYLNRAPYGNGTFGVEAASRRYFGKSASELSLAQAAVLAALPRWPNGYNPFASSPAAKKSRRRHGRSALLTRQRFILKAMYRQKRISKNQMRIALAEPVDFERAQRPFFAPHFTRWVLQTAKRDDVVLQTSLHLPLQREIAKLVRHTISSLKSSGVTNAAVMVVDNTSGEVLAHVGSADFFDQKHAGQIDGTVALRQPGSAIKPFTYALALEQGMHPASLLADIPAQFQTPQGDYAPRNYDDIFRGPVRLRQALASSLNIPAVRLAEKVGVAQLLTRLKKIGFSSLKKPAVYYGLGLTLGNGEVTLRELVAGYATLARNGRYLPLKPLLYRVDARDKKSAPKADTPRRVFSKKVAYLIGDMLSDPRARAATFGRHGPLETPFFAAVKTGTSKDFRDNWTVGYNTRLTVGVWVGNFDGQSMHNVSGVTGAGPLWRRAFATCMRVLELEDRKPTKPRGLVQHTVCALSGQLAGPSCPAVLDETFADWRPQKPCGFHRRARIDKRNGLLASAACANEHVEYKELVHYPSRYLRWAKRRRLPLSPRRYSPLCAPQVASDRTNAVRIRFPNSGDSYAIDPDLAREYQSIPLEAEVSGASAKEVRWLVNGKLVAKAKPPYSSKLRAQVGTHRIVAMLPNGQKSRPVTITVR